MKRTLILLTSVVLLVLAGVVLANGAPTINWWTIGGGGGHAEAGIYALDATVGQTVTGVAMTGDSELCAGFWCVAAGEYVVYLPAIMKNYAR